MADENDDLGISTATGANGTENTTPEASGAAGGDEWKPPTKAEFEKLQRDLASANQESKNRREKLQELQRATEDADGKQARERAEAAEAKYKPIAVRAAAKAAFLEAGLSGAAPEKVAKLTRLLDLDAIEITDDGDVKGLDAQVTALKADFPEMFGAKQQRVPKLDTGNKQGGGGKAQSSADRIAAQILGGAA